MSRLIRQVLLKVSHLGVLFYAEVANMMGFIDFQVLDPFAFAIFEGPFALTLT